jgi:hypothetical protein
MTSLNDPNYKVSYMLRAKKADLKEKMKKAGLCFVTFDEMTAVHTPTYGCKFMDMQRRNHNY